MNYFLNGALFNRTFSCEYFEFAKLSRRRLSNET